jgi:hypothetical protein
MNDTTNASIKGRKIVIFSFGDYDEAYGKTELYETREAAEQAAKDWMFEVVEDDQELISLIEEQGIYRTAGKVRDVFGCWFSIVTQEIL